MDNPDYEYTNTTIFLRCYNRLFSIRSKQSMGYSLALTPGQAESLGKAFTDAGIPYTTQINSLDECVLEKVTEEDPAPANSRVVFKIENQEYNLLNFNDLLIKYSVAENIAKAFDNHFIEAFACKVGNYANVSKAEVIERSAKVNSKSIESKPKDNTKEICKHNEQPRDHSAMLFKSHTIYCSTPDCICYQVCRTKYDSFWAVRCDQNVNQAS